uniref:Protein kinase domain-containing protein n=1 Tax=Chromera velia CCMP2878 TaxID=1169474 RepID=A0A0G4HAE4_9ALVE|mmetsp:Transcript_45065/g.88857  ORF Transcript_45065/g.88857 Transcript_45065/m.88857 type:complete len:349 (+) Transcript_45065:346-1392(+)|eukprot:Cvel_25647.t1-p1 / transcript=Cvel_25647.t1 / gene=Cvel_25647 / organism=Chromera_velia_CCMP2878 / gene_product=MAP kinase kinase kinase mkh1, putative / transcript_product=MAP kinase kinase kinase mkh1, putative / location=Cvel_scaffold2934:6037-7080(+) / protein_length=348 / sequence_SO=supercontig / SO=protein_coding / is_pseudo=false
MASSSSSRSVHRKSSTAGRSSVEVQLDFSSWRKGDKIGSGGQGDVYRALVDGRVMAVKQFRLVESSEGGGTSIPQSLQDELSAYQKLEHNRIVRYLHFSQQEERGALYLNIFLEYMPGGSISKMVKTYGPLPEPLVRKFTRQVLEGLQYLHSKHVVHRDVKGGNILVDANGDAKLSDFGTSQHLDPFLETKTLQGGHVKGTALWMAPEAISHTQKSKPGRRSDIWGLGCLVIEMLSGQKPWGSALAMQSPTEILKEIVTGKGTPLDAFQDLLKAQQQHQQQQQVDQMQQPQGQPQPPPAALPGYAEPIAPPSPECIDFIRRCLTRDMQKRPHADDLLEHPFVRDGTPN